MGFKSPASVTYLTQYHDAVVTEEVIDELDRLLRLQCSKGGPVGHSPRVYCAFHKVYKLLGIRIEPDPDCWWEEKKVVKACHYGPDKQEVALAKALGKPLEDASDDDLLRVRYSDFKRALEHP